MSRVAVDFGVGQGAKRRADIRRHLGQASNVGRHQNQRTPGGREAEGPAGCVARSLQPAPGMRLARSLLSGPSASTRGPPQYFNSLLVYEYIRYTCDG
jgi:hypothetical protein